ncbi:MAG TPA: deoxyribonuclease IV [Bacteroidia bacterium]|nr:deoxyribonuclease IV [Bacteroidia bacterium]
MMLGVHCSVSGGLQLAFDEAAKLNLDTFQIFTRNQRQWKAKPISEEEKKDFAAAWKLHPEVKAIFAHSSYLINLASADKSLQDKSVGGITDEVKRCHELGLFGAVLHPGAAGEATEHDAMKRIAEGLKEALAATHGSHVKILLENTAGQGSHVGYKFEHTREIMDMVGSDRIGTCFDTCHAFAAGYDIRTEHEFEEVMKEYDHIIGLKHLHAIHLNDSKGDLGSRIDRHEHIGQGRIGVDAFRFMMKKFPHIPKCIETDAENNMDEVNITLLRKLAGE